MDLMSPSIGLIFWHTVILIILIFFLSKFAWIPINNFIDKREKTIINSIKNSEKLSKELKNIEKHKNYILKQAQQEKNKIIKHSLIMKEEIKKDFIKQGMLEKKRIIESSKKDISLEINNIRTKLQEDMQFYAIQLAEKILITKLYDNNCHKKFIERIIKNKQS